MIDCPECGGALIHQDNVPTDPRLSSLGSWETEHTDINRALAAIREYGPMSAIALKRRLGERNIAYEIHLLLRTGCIEKMPAPTGERYPVYRWLEA